MEVKWNNNNEKKNKQTLQINYERKTMKKQK